MIGVRCRGPTIDYRLCLPSIDRRPHGPAGEAAAFPLKHSGKVGIGRAARRLPG
jgi:hypothetical protein